MRLLVMLTSLIVAASAAAQAPSMEIFEPLVGVWETEDTYYPASGDPSVERGVRTCRFALRQTYLHCETVATNTRGVERSYWFLINHNAVMDRYEMLSVWSNVPFKAVHQVAALESGRGWQLRDLIVVGDSEDNAHASELVLESTDRLVWTGRRVTAGSDPETAPISFVETWTRRP